MRGTRVQSLGQEEPLRKELATAPIFLPGESHEKRSLADYSPWSCKESDPTEHASTHTQDFVLNAKNLYNFPPTQFQRQVFLYLKVILSLLISRSRTSKEKELHMYH